VAPDARHAHHMTTHIFLAMGMWDDVVGQNEIASGPDRSTWTPGHYTDWLGYGYLQQGRYGEAQRLLDLVRQNMSRARGAVPAILAEMRADYVVNTEQWNCPCLAWPIDLTGMRTRDQALDAFVAGFSALRRNDRASVAQSLSELARFRRSAAAAAHGGDPVPRILEQELQALVAQTDGKVAAA